MSAEKLRITLLADEWNSSKGGLSTMNRELAIQLAKHPNVAVTFFVPKCTEADKKAACSHNISIVEAIERYGYDEVDWLSFPPRELVIDTIIGHGVKLGKQAQVIRESHHCTWMQVVHTAPEKLAMFKTYSAAIAKGDEKQWAEVNLCKIADRVVAVGPKLYDIYSRYLSRCGKKVINLTPGIFTELSDLKPSTQESKEFWVLVFGRGDSEDFELKGFDIAARAVSELNDESYHLIFVGAPSGNEKQVADKLLEQGLIRRQLTVKGFLEDRDDLATLLSTANLAIIPSRTEGFGLTALEALSAGLPFLVSQNSGFGEALQEIPFGSSWIVPSEDPKKWAEAIKDVREKGSETALKECQDLRACYAEKHSWEKQCNDIVEMLLALVNDELEMPQPASATETEGKMVDCNENPSVTERRREDSSSSDIDTVTTKTATSNSDQGARPKEMLPSNTKRTRRKVSAGEVEPAVVTPLQNRGQAARKKSGKNIEEKQSKATSTGRRLQTVSNESLEHLTGVSKDKLQMPQSASGTEPEGERVEGKTVPTSIRTSPLQEDQHVTEQRREDSSSSVIRLTTANTTASNSKKEEKFEYQSGPKEVESSRSTQLPSQKNPVQRNQSMDEQRPEGSSYSCSKNAKQRRDYSLFHRSNNAEERSEDGALRNRKIIDTSETKMTQLSNERGASPNEIPASNKSVHTASERNPLQRYQSMDEQRGEGIRSSNSSSAEQKRQDFSFGRSYRAEQRRDGSLFSDSRNAKQRREGSLFSDSRNAEQRRDGSLFSDSRNAEQRRDGSLFSDSRNAEQRREGSLFSDSRNAEQIREDNFQSNLGNGTYRVNMAPVHIEQRALHTKTEDLAILCCNLSEDSLHAVMQVFEDIAPRLNLSPNPPVANLSPDEIKGYLTEAHLKFCILVVDGKTVKDAYENLPQRKEEYRGLLETAANEVVEKLIILVCDTCSLPAKDEEIVSRTIVDIIKRRGKGFTTWLKKGKLAVDPDVLVQFLMSTSPAPQSNQQTNLSRGFQQTISDAPGSAAESFSSYSAQSQSDPLQIIPSDREPGDGCNVPNMQQPTQQAATTIEPYPAISITGEPVLLRSILRMGIISYQLEDLQLWEPEFIVPHFINEKLFQQFCYTPAIGVTIVQGFDGQFRCSVDPELIEISRSRYEGLQIAANETLQLKTRIRNGLVSFQESDVHFRFGNRRIPQKIINNLKDEYCATPCGELYIISDEKGNLRSIVKIGKIDRLCTFRNKKGF